MLCIAIAADTSNTTLNPTGKPSPSGTVIVAIVVPLLVIVLVLAVIVIVSVCLCYHGKTTSTHCNVLTMSLCYEQVIVVVNYFQKDPKYTSECSMRRSSMLS